MPPLNPLQIMPVPPPTAPSSTAPPAAPSRAATTCSGRTWNPLMSLSTPSHVSATTGQRPQEVVAVVEHPGDGRVACDADAVRVRDEHGSFEQAPPRRSRPSPSSRRSRSARTSRQRRAPSTPAPRGRMAVTPVRTGPSPRTSGPSPWTIVACPTSTPATSVIALSGPGVPSNGTPTSRARSCAWAAGARATSAATTTRTAHPAPPRPTGSGRRGTSRVGRRAGRMGGAVTWRRGWCGRRRPCGRRRSP